MPRFGGMNGLHSLYAVLFWGAFSILAAVVTYLLVLTVASFLTPVAGEHASGKRRRAASPPGTGAGEGSRSRSPSRDARPRFALLVPAHNEEAMVGALLESLNAQDYPRELCRVFVVADNCTDATAEVARRQGACVFERTDTERRGKGHALQWLLEQIGERGERFDAFAVFDADSLVDAAFLRAMAVELAQGREALQGHYGVRNPEDGVGAALRCAAYALVNFLRPLGKNALGCATGLKGNGMCFAARVIERHGWSAHSLAEDAEYGAALLLDRIPVRFVPGARVWAQMPPAVRQSESQNLRWEAGRLLVARRWVPALLRAGLRRRDPVLLEAAVDLLIPPLSTVVGGILALAGAAWLGPPLAGVRPASALLAVALGAHVAAGLVRAGAPGAVWRALLCAPRYCLWKVALYTRALVRKPPSAWVRTRRFP